MAKQRSDGEGTVYLNHVKDCPRPVDGRGRATCGCRWVGALVIGYRDGKPVRRKVSATTASGAANRLRELREKHAETVLPPTGKPMTVEKWMKHWLTQVAPRRVRPTTLASYTSKVEQYINPLLGHHLLENLTADHIEAAWDELLTKGNPKADDPKPLSPASVRQAHRILSRALKVAVMRNRIRRNPADGNSMDAPAVPEKEMGVLDIEQVRQVLAAAKGDRMEARWVAALALGLRQGEALGLRWVDVDLDDGVLRVRQAMQRVKGKGLVFGEPKSQKSKRDIALDANVVTVLRAHKKMQNAERLAAGSSWHDSGLVFTQPNGKPIDQGRDNKRWGQLLIKAGVPRVRLHDARHSAATLMLLSGVSTRVVMDTLGHSQMSVTMKYQHAVDQMKRDAADKVGAALWG